MKVTVAFKKYDKNPTFVGNIINKIIKWKTKSKYYHCEIIINDYWVSSNPEVGSVYRYELQTLRDNYDYITVSVDESKDKEVQEFIDSQIGKKYDWWGIFFSQFIDIHEDDKNEWFCSEIVSHILKLYGVKLEKKCDQYNPGNLYKALNCLKDLYK